MKTRGKSAKLWLAIVLDAALILLFAGIGRDAHHQGEGVLGILATAWPFLVGAALGWGVVRAWRSPSRIWPAGVGVWLGALIGGMLLRALTGQVVVLAFIIVASLFLALMLLGWRVVCLIISALRSKLKTL
ncbi:MULTISPECIES: DUF3054 domain-containing protein [Arthrobacter]|uniref:DUF3054 domain-containing protein n=2 Tax=Arthrobacter TaxID=1663 RepID=A0ABU9KK98_9MICC|nr:DUF3054 domain-containing protein [Arthrobacter sp. YJM1]MDP5225988.1 DUF3054 domain-containing protein [Arthrobacter sp. YJM1]